jgi:hypothetical protein
MKLAHVRVGSFATELAGPTCHLMSALAPKATQLLRGSSGIWCVSAWMICTTRIAVTARQCRRWVHWATVHCRYPINQDFIDLFVQQSFVLVPRP